MYNIRKKYCAVMWLKGYYYSNDRNKSILLLDDVNERGIITISEENILQVNTQVQYLLHFSLHVSKEIKEKQLVCVAGEKNLWFHLFKKIS